MTVPRTDPTLRATLPAGRQPALPPWAEPCQALLDGLPDPAWIKDRAGRYVAVNAHFVRLLGVEPTLGQQLLGTTGHDLRPGLPFPESRPHEQQVLSEGREIVSEEEVPQACGAVRCFRVSRAPFRDSQGAISGTVGVARDVTEERARERRLLHAERLATLGTLLSGVAHELNNPLNTILNFAQLLLMDPRPEDDTEALRLVQREAERAAGIVCDLRTIARQTREPGVERSEVDLNDVLRHALKLRRYTLETRNIAVGVELACAPPVVWASRMQVEQVLLNLILNSEQALAERCEGRRLWLRTALTDGGAILEVTDNGPGIPPENLEHIFEPFFTTKSTSEGMGMGLSLVRRIVEAHGGEVRVATPSGGGASISVFFPRPRPRAPDAAKPSAALSVHPRRSVRVLLVDDEDSIRSSMQRFLERRGHQVDAAADGAEALALLQARPEGAPYDVILSDLRMPGLGGDQLLERLRERGDGMESRVVFITGDAACGDAARILSSTGAVTLLKPVNLHDVVRIVERFGDRDPQSA